LYFIDMHCHCHELGADLLKRYENVMRIVCVSDDIESSMKTILLSKVLDIVPCIGIHPWEAHNHSERVIEDLAKFIKVYDVRCLGEVGLDKRFYPHTFEHQLRIFTSVLTLSKEYDLLLNLHTAGAWREAYDLVVKHDISKAYFHWYTGPLDLLDNIVASGYFVGINPAWKVQDKHKQVIARAPVTSMLTESDSPYHYKGLEMRPDLVVETLEYIANVKGIELEEAKSIIYQNFTKLLN